MSEQKKALMIASVASMIDQFNMPNIELLQSLDYHVDVAADFKNPGNISNERSKDLIRRLKAIGTEVIDIPIPRVLNPTAVIRAYKLVKMLITTRHYDLIHCHSPIGGAITRLAAKNERKNGTRVMYTAHGFHFYTGASLKNWIIFYPIEKWLSRYTDVLITINKEDYERATEKFKAKKTVYVPGIGVDTKKFGIHYAGDEKRRELGISSSDIMLLSVGELNDNKNHEVVIRALAKLETKPYYIIVGKGDKEKYLKNLISKLNIQDRVKLVGLRSDVIDLYDAADVFVLPSFREGLSVSLMEAMASGLPVVCSRIRGNIDLIDNQGGFFFDPIDVETVLESIRKSLSANRDAQGNYNREKIKNFDMQIVAKLMSEEYEKVASI